MAKYYVGIREVHISTREVEAGSPEAALALIVEGVEDGDEVAMEFSHTLDPDTWTVEDDSGGSESAPATKGK